jgi:hypothetical protein
MPENSIEITIQPVYLKNNYLYIPVKHAGFFPPGAPYNVQPVVIETDRGLISAELQYNSKAYI